MARYDRLRNEIAQTTLGHISPDSLSAILNNEIKLTHAAHVEFEEFMRDGRKMFAPVEVKSA